MKPYEIVVDQILNNLESWNLPWTKSRLWWIPCNYETNLEYRWLNKLILLFDDYTDKRYLTAKQVNKLGWKIKKWEKATKIIFWKYSDTLEDEKEITYSYPIIKYYNVFNIEQIEDIKPTPKKELELLDRYNKAQSIVDDYIDKPTIQIWNEPCYIPSKDIIQIPDKNNFNTLDNYYSTLFHELIHSTWSTKRLNRFWENKAYYGNKEYSFEELVAEIWAMFLSQKAGIIQNTQNNSIAYIKWWLEYLNKNKKEIIYASSQAEKSVSYISNCSI